MNALSDFPLADFTLPNLPPAQAVPVHHAAQLTEGGREAKIVLNGMVYSLRITRQGKLILTK